MTSMRRRIGEYLRQGRNSWRQQWADLGMSGQVAMKKGGSWLGVAKAAGANSFFALRSTNVLESLSDNPSPLSLQDPK